MPADSTNVMASRGNETSMDNPKQGAARTLPPRAGRPSDLRDIYKTTHQPGKPKVKKRPQDKKISERETKAQEADKEDVSEPSEAEIRHDTQERAYHRLSTTGTPKDSPGNPGFSSLETVSFVVDPDNEKKQRRVTIRAGSWVLGAVDRFDAGDEAIEDSDVAYVGDILQDQYGQIHLGVRWTWKWTSQFVGATGPQTLQNESRIALQQNHCEDGKFYVRDESGKWMDTLVWAAVIGKATVEHSNKISDAKHYGKRNHNLFFYDKQFDHTIWRLSDVRDISSSLGDIEPPKRLPFEDLTMIDGFSGLGTVAIAAKASGMKPQWAIESDEAAFNACNCNLDYKLRADSAQTLEKFISEVKKGNEKYPKKGEVGVLHLSPPCQTLSLANRHTDIDRVKTALLQEGALVPQCVELIKLLMPKFVTVEEVPEFLSKTLPLDYRIGKAAGSETVRPVLHFLSPLIDEGYQVEICVLNSIYYGVPQTRKRLFIFLAMHGYELPSAPPAWYHNASLPRWMQFRKTDPMRRDSMSWNSIYMTPRGYPAPPAFAKPANKANEDAQPATVKEAEDMQFAEALEQSGDNDAISKAAERGPVQTVDNPRNLPPSVTAAEAMCGLPEPRVYQGISLARSLPVPYVEDGPRSRFADYMRRPCVTNHTPRDIHDQTLKATDGVSLVDGKRKVGSQLQRCLDIAKNKVRTSAGDPYGTVCTKRDQMNPRSNLHHKHDRLLTLMERKRIQSIPDDVHVSGNSEQAACQVGNAVPFLLGRAVMDAVVKAATGETVNPVPLLSGYDGPAPEEALSPRRDAPGGDEPSERTGKPGRRTEDESGSSEPEAATFTFSGILSPKKDAESLKAKAKYPRGALADKREKRGRPPGSKNVVRPAKRTKKDTSAVEDIPEMPVEGISDEEAVDSSPREESGVSGQQVESDGHEDPLTSRNKHAGQKSGGEKQAKTRKPSSLVPEIEEANTSRIDQDTAKSKVRHPIIARLLSSTRKSQEVRKPRAREGVSGRNVIQRVLAAARRGSHQPGGVACEGVQPPKACPEAVQAGSPQKTEKDDSAKTQRNASASPASIKAASKLEVCKSAAKQRAEAPFSLPGFSKSRIPSNKGAAGVREAERLIGTNPENIPATPSTDGDYAGAAPVEAPIAERTNSEGDGQAGVQDGGAGMTGTGQEQAVQLVSMKESPGSLQSRDLAIGPIIGHSSGPAAQKRSKKNRDLSRRASRHPIGGVSSPAGASPNDPNNQGRMRGLPRLATGTGSEDSSLPRRVNAPVNNARQGRSKRAAESVIDLCSDSEASFHECSAMGDESEVCIIE